jgi:hypothetical protein
MRPPACRPIAAPCKDRMARTKDVFHFLFNSRSAASAGASPASTMPWGASKLQSADCSSKAAGRTSRTSVPLLGVRNSRTPALSGAAPSGRQGMLARRGLRDRSAPSTRAVVEDRGLARSDSQFRPAERIRPSSLIAAGTAGARERTFTLTSDWFSPSQFRSEMRISAMASALRGPTTRRRSSGSMRITNRGSGCPPLRCRDAARSYSGRRRVTTEGSPVDMDDVARGVGLWPELLDERCIIPVRNEQMSCCPALQRPPARPPARACALRPSETAEGEAKKIQLLPRRRKGSSSGRVWDPRTLWSRYRSVREYGGHSGRWRDNRPQVAREADQSTNLTPWLQAAQGTGCALWHIRRQAIDHAVRKRLS